MNCSLAVAIFGNVFFVSLPALIKLCQQCLLRILFSNFTKAVFRLPWIKVLFLGQHWSCADINFSCCPWHKQPLAKTVGYYCTIQSGAEQKREEGHGKGKESGSACSEVQALFQYLSFVNVGDTVTPSSARYVSLGNYSVLSRRCSILKLISELKHLALSWSWQSQDRKAQPTNPQAEQNTATWLLPKSSGLCL